MTKYSDMQLGPEDDIQEISGPEQYLRAGEELLIYATDIKIKKFTFEAYLTDRRLFLIDQNEKKPGVFAKEIPVQSIVEGYLEQTPAQEPVLVLSIRTSDDDIRTMKMTFQHIGEDRTTEVEEWIHLVQHGRREIAREPQTVPETRAETPFIAPQAKDVSETMVFPTPPMKKKDIPPPVKEERVEAFPAVIPQKEATPPVHVPPSQTQIMFCHHCGRRIPPNANFCPFCGTRMHQSHHEESQARLPLNSREQEVPPPEDKKSEEKRGWRRFFRRK
jgi:hypothetical protein